LQKRKEKKNKKTTRRRSDFPHWAVPRVAERDHVSRTFPRQNFPPSDITLNPSMDVQGNAPERVRKRRRRTMACTQCRTRKLRCDREYPTCSRCLKSRTPNICTYEDGFLWQQPTTVATAFASDQRSTVSAPRDTPIDTPPDSGPMSTRTERFPASEPPRLAMAGGPMHHDYHGLTGNALAPPYRGQPHDRERKDCFLETVLGAPKAAVNQEPYVNMGLLQRPKRQVPAAEQDMQAPSRVDHAHVDEEDDPLSSTDQLDLAPRMMMRGRETKTRFTGSGIFASLVAQVRMPPPLVCFSNSNCEQWQSNFRG
jgi:hypothetical protein